MKTFFAILAMVLVSLMSTAIAADSGGISIMLVNANTDEPRMDPNVQWTLTSPSGKKSVRKNWSWSMSNMEPGRWTIGWSSTFTGNTCAASGQVEVAPPGSLRFLGQHLKYNGPQTTVLAVCKAR